ncbi:deoxyribonuclease IV [Paenibacillus harenae]|uniref:deoxyribonuclease IV n=1 Tax=Paenibacillus harenae TaxID=306543 RepID=UPI00278ECAFA|nr:deoxyribonuclease IV [Paenibacillus harenae]MDQ0057907.1 deoxyribonuclease-4 [Paenibacillus harenae]
MKVGSHVTIRRGYLGAAQEAVKLGASAFQYFPKNPRSLSIKSIDLKDTGSCARYCQEHGLVSIAHTPYTTNLSIEDPELQQVTIRSILNDLAITEACGSIGLVVHFGKYKGADPLVGYKLMIDMLNQILTNWEGKSLVLIENNAGQGAKMGITLEELVQIRKLTYYPEKIGYCFDTCHAFASGLWAGHNWTTIMEKGTQLGYFDNLKAIHLNDSVYPSSSCKDRHANVGKGYIGENNMKAFLQSSVIRDLPLILETPSSQAYSHRDEIKYVYTLAAGQTINK